MSLEYDSSCAPLYTLPPHKYAQEAILPPKQAYPLIKPLTEKHIPMYCCCPKPYRIMTDIIHISTCFHNNAAIDKEGNLWRWGAETIAKDAKTGVISEDLSQDVSYQPKLQFSNVETVSAGAWHMMCITKDGTLWGWGDNEFGQLGLGDCLSRTNPTLIMPDVTLAYAGENQSFAIKKDKSLWGWGKNYALFSERPYLAKNPVHLMDGVIQVSAGESTLLAVREDNTLWGIGSGIIRNKSFEKPSILMEDVKIVSVEPRSCFCMVLTSNGDLYSLGLASVGSVIRYFERNRLSDGPIKVFDNVADVKTGRNFTLIRTEDNRLFASGENIVGQCGIGKSTRDIFKPIFVMDHVNEIAAGYYHGMALQENGDVWIWGGDYGVPIK